MSRSENRYDAVIVGAGVAGALVAKYLTRAGLDVLVLEAGSDDASRFDGYAKHLAHFYTATSKGPESAWPAEENAPQPDTADILKNRGYFVQLGPDRYGSSYSRVQGGSTLHWLGVSLRMLPEDFAIRTRYGVGRDWPLRYEDLEPFYRKAEYELGVSADVADQQYLGHVFPQGYDYPMQRVPLSYSDQALGAAVDGMQVQLGNEARRLQVRSYPAARNSIPRGQYVPVGVADSRTHGQAVPSYVGQRCQGNTSCTPICPVQAKYNAGKTLAQADKHHLRIKARAVACRVMVDASNGEVKGIAYKQYGPQGVAEDVAKARVYVLAAHAVENAKLMLTSGLASTSGMMGKTLMDHPALYAWGLAPKPIGAYRGPLSTAGIEDLRGGGFRSRHAAFRFDIGNDGWRASTGDPDTSVMDAVVNKNLFGKDLRDYLASLLQRQVRFSLAVEQLPDESNSISIDPAYLDPLGIPRPVIRYRISEYTLAGMAAATRVYKQIFQQANIEDRTEHAGRFPSTSTPFEGSSFEYHGMGHFAGAHTMGSSKSDSVLNPMQRCWDHSNLYMVGAGSMPTMGTSNPTLTLAALAIRTAEHVAAELKESTTYELAPAKIA